MSAAWLVIRFLRRSDAPKPVRNAPVRVRIGGARYASQFIGLRSGGWALTMPSGRDMLRPIVPGEPAQIEVSHARGLMVMETIVRGNAGVLLVDAPRKWRVEDRRCTPRNVEVGHVSARLDGDRVSLVDLSTCGAKLKSREARLPGERVKIEIGGHNRSIFGWVIGSVQQHDRFVTRIRFEEEDRGLLAVNR
jgi:hypothetical protein